MTDIGYDAFSDCTGLTHITIGSGVKNLSGFSGCTALTEVTIPNGVTAISNRAFYQCVHLRNITIPGSVKSIGDYACYETGLVDVTIPEGVESIGAYAFFQCLSLRSVVIPDSVTDIGKDAFHLASGDRDKGAYFLLGNNIETVERYSDALGYNGYSESRSKAHLLYCHEYSKTDYTLTREGYEVHYLEKTDIDEIRKIGVKFKDESNVHTVLTFSEDGRNIEYREATAAVGEQVTAIASIVPPWAIWDNPQIVWESSNPDAASVDGGVITVQRDGRVIITAKVNSVSSICGISGYLKTRDFTLPDEIWVIAKTTRTIVPTSMKPYIAASSDLKWSTADSSVAAVNGYGQVTGYIPGDVLITAVNELGVTDKCLVHVCYPVTALTFEQTEIKASVGIPLQVKVRAAMRDQECVNQVVAFSSSSPAIAAIDQNGILFPKQEGTVTITAAAASGITASAVVTVAPSAAMNLPSGMKELDEEAFFGTSASVYILPNGTVSIGQRAFAYLTAAPAVIHVPASVSAIASDAFEGSDVLICAPKGSAALIYAQEKGCRWAVDP